MSDDDKDINWLLLAITLMTIAMLVVAIADHIWRLIAKT
jgi:hypothetical protein